MESTSPPGLEQVGSRLRRPLCSDRRIPTSGVLGPPRKLTYKDRICDIKALGLAHAVAPRRPSASSELEPVLLYTKAWGGLPTCCGDQGS